MAIDMAQASKDFYKQDKKQFVYMLINELTGETVAIYSERPRMAEIEKQYPNFWDHYRLAKNECPCNYCNQLNK